MELDDDYKSFLYRRVQGETLRSTKVKDINKVLEEMLYFYKNTPFQSIAMGQGGDYVGGVENGIITD